MKRCTAGILFFSILFFPHLSSAEITDPGERRQVLALIALLEAQIEILIEKLTALEAEKRGSVLGETTTRAASAETKKQKSYGPISIDGYRPSKFYDGSYVALYVTDGYELNPIARDSVDADHEEVWETFVEIAGENFVRERMSEFRVYVDKNAEFDAFIDRIGKEDRWVLAVNFYNLDLKSRGTRDWLNRLLLHEYGHVLFDNRSIIDDFQDIFWNESDLAHAGKVANTTSTAWRDEMVSTYYEYHRNDFVSVYAATNPIEDLIESFVYFVMEGSTSGSTEANQKTNFFLSYPWVVSVAERIRHDM